MLTSVRMILVCDHVAGYICSWRRSSHRHRAQIYRRAGPVSRHIVTNWNKKHVKFSPRCVFLMSWRCSSPILSTRRRVYATHASQHTYTHTTMMPEPMPIAGMRIMEVHHTADHLAQRAILNQTCKCYAGAIRNSRCAHTKCSVGALSSTLHSRRCWLHGKSVKDLANGSCSVGQWYLRFNFDRCVGRKGDCCFNIIWLWFLSVCVGKQ